MNYRHRWKYEQIINAVFPPSLRGNPGLNTAMLSGEVSCMTRNAVIVFAQTCRPERAKRNLAQQVCDFFFLSCDSRLANATVREVLITCIV
jgi:hypothetical protein